VSNWTTSGRCNTAATGKAFAFLSQNSPIAIYYRRAMHKGFDGWNDAKKSIQPTSFGDFVHMREVWWCALGVNLGREQDGNEEFFERPILVIRKFNQDMVLIVPLASQPKRTLMVKILVSVPRTHAPS
jgi:PemK-like, MazF-like toxin of type II toxin-antitoxin system